jgi:hypothetical protein
MERKVRKPSPWITHIREFATSRNTSYACAMSSPLCKEQYQQKKEMLKNPKKEIKVQEEDFDQISGRLQQLVLLTPTPILVKALVSLGFKGKIPGQAILKVMAILQNFNTIPKMKSLISAIEKAK